MAEAAAVRVRPASREDEDDLGGVMDVQARSYPAELLEGSDVLGGILDHGMSWIAEDHLGTVVGYAAVHASEPYRVHALHSVPAPVLTRCCCCFVHDLAVAPGHRGRGVGRALLEAVEDALQQQQQQPQQQQQLHLHLHLHLQLVAVGNDARAFWERAGFRPVRRSLDAASESALAGYGACGRLQTFMQKRTLTSTAARSRPGGSAPRRT